MLGAILLEPALLPRAIEVLVPDEFYKEAHRKIFGAMIRLFERGEPADAITVTETLRREGVFEESRRATPSWRPSRRRARSPPSSPRTPGSCARRRSSGR